MTLAGNPSAYYMTGNESSLDVINYSTCILVSLLRVARCGQLFGLASLGLGPSYAWWMDRRGINK
jgi:hypothetical protein